MDTRFQFILLNIKTAVFLAVFLVAAPVSFAAQEDNAELVKEVDALDINNEVFELGVFTGIINIENFTSEVVYGISATFRASEDYFIQYNYLQANVSLSSAEKNLTEGESYFSSGDRKFTHYDLLVGYNIFQGEFFSSPNNANLSTLYVVAGVGDTEFGDESSMTYTFGLGYQVALSRRLGLHFDFKDYIYRSSLVTGSSRSVNAAQISTGVKFLF